MVADAMAELANRLRPRHEEIAREMVARYRDEIVDYAASSDNFLEVEGLQVTPRVMTNVIHNIDAHALSPSDNQAPELRLILSRRPHQDVALPPTHHAYRLFSEHLSDE